MNKNILKINEKFKYKININYPVENSKIANKIIYKVISNIENKFINSSKRNAMLNIYYTLYVTYDKYRYNNITSYIFKVSEYTGGAHPNNYLVSLRIRDNGSVITINTLLDKAPNILIKLSNFSREKLISENKNNNEDTLSMIINGTRPNVKNFNNFAFTNDGLLVFFDYYQVAPYYSGIQKVLIPYDNLL